MRKVNLGNQNKMMPPSSDCLNRIKLVLIIFQIFVSFKSYPQIISLSHAYAHNDYWHKRPLYDALENGFTHIEADIYLRNDKLIVAHVLPRLRMSQTLDSLYFKPLVDCIKGTNSHGICPDFPVTLMIDIKSGANRTYLALTKLLKKYKPFLTTCDNGQYHQGKITVVLTGHKPIGLLNADQERLAFVDEDLMQVKTDTINPNLYQTASCRYSRLMNWMGEGPLPLTERAQLCTYVDAAHRLGKKVRLWASPENKVVWQELLDCGVDLINTDQLVNLKNFLLHDVKTYAKVN